jgi:dihydroorotase
MSYLLKNATLPNGSKADLAIQDGHLVAANSLAKDHQVIDLTGKQVLPGLVDLHTHLREPGFEESETVATGSLSAVRGGFTAISAMANTSPVADTAGVVEQVYRLGQAAGLCDVFPIGAVTEGLNGQTLSEIGAMADSAARVRVFSDDGKCVFGRDCKTTTKDHQNRENAVFHILQSIPHYHCQLRHICRDADAHSVL